MQYPKDLTVWEHAPGRRLAEVVVQLRNVKGAFAQCSKVIADMDINVLSGFDSASSASRVGTWSFFADVTDSKFDPRQLEERLLKLPVVEGVEVLMADDGFMVDRKHFPVRFSSRRALIMRTEALSDMFSHLWRVFGSGAATILDQMAEAMGRYSAQEILEDFGKQFAVQSLDELLHTYTALGFADVQVTRSKGDGDSFVLHAKDLFECQANARDKLTRKSIFFKGHLRGFITTIFRAEFDVTEVQCVAEGDEECSFAVAKIETVVPRVPIRSEQD